MTNNPAPNPLQLDPPAKPLTELTPVLFAKLRRAAGALNMHSLGVDGNYLDDDEELMLALNPYLPYAKGPQIVLDARAGLQQDIDRLDAAIKLLGLETPTEPTPDPFTPTRWWRVLTAQGTLWAETSDEDEARAAMHPGATLHRLYATEPRQEWRNESHLTDTG